MSKTYLSWNSFDSFQLLCEECYLAKETYVYDEGITSIQGEVLHTFFKNAFERIASGQKCQSCEGELSDMVVIAPAKVHATASEFYEETEAVLKELEKPDFDEMTDEAIANWLQSQEPVELILPQTIHFMFMEALAGVAALHEVLPFNDEVLHRLNVLKSIFMMTLKQMKDAESPMVDLLAQYPERHKDLTELVLERMNEKSKS